MNNQWNQYKNKKIRAHGKPDIQELIDFENRLRNYNFSVDKEPFILLDREYGSLVHMSYFLSEAQVKDKRFIIHHPDFVIRKNGRLTLIEIDGAIHNSKASAKTQARNEDYDNAKMDYIVLNTEDLLFQGIDPMKELDKQLLERELITQNQIISKN